ncbi:hypothetical protein C8Q80DRAFT_1115445 [Daedaleopsis nitida]|nr:hypothetical protein C8Q80DRAFT_1115445 [Daedaleopsis nitida]
MHRASLLSLLTLISAPLASMALTNITVDDTLGNSEQNLQIVYQPEGAWSPGQACADCEAHVDTSKVLDGTWHDVTYLADNPPAIPLSANLTFNGVAIYVYCIVTRSPTNPFGNSDMTFYLDGEPVGVFQQMPNEDPSYEYSVPVYVNTSISAGNHTFALVNGRKGGLTALALLDYIIVS